MNLLNVPSAPALPHQLLPPSIPLIYHSAGRTRPPRATAVALSLYQLFSKRDGKLRFYSRDALIQHFKLAQDALIILSGTENDRPLERWWGLSERKDIIAGLRHLGIALITSPNYSLFDDVPRLDNLYNMKRIALIWSETQRTGLPCALHLNARTDTDWDRWIEFLNHRSEIDMVAFEFGTGAGTRGRIQWYVHQLCHVADAVHRPLQLIVRGGLNFVGPLRASYANVSFIDTASFMKAQKRQRAIVRGGRLRWEASPTALGAAIDDLLDFNADAVSQMAGATPAEGESPVNEAACLV